MTVQLHHFAKGFGHTANMRKRTRVLRGPKPVRQVELWYKGELLKIVRQMSEAVKQELLPLIRQALPATDHAMVGDARYSMDLSDKIDTLSRKFGSIRDTAKRLSQLAAEYTAKRTDEQLIAAVKQSVSIDISGALAPNVLGEAMSHAVAANVDLITSIPEQYFGKVRQTVSQGFSDGLRWEDIAEKIQQVTETAENRAKLIARDQVSKMNGAFNEARQTSLGIEEYVWQTAGDERVRDSHAAHDGKTFRWDDPPEDTGNPGEDINCRCVALPVFNLDKEEANLGITDE